MTQKIPPILNSVSKDDHYESWEVLLYCCAKPEFLPDLERMDRWMKRRARIKVRQRSLGLKLTHGVVGLILVVFWSFSWGISFPKFTEWLGVSQGLAWASGITMLTVCFLSTAIVIPYQRRQIASRMKRFKRRRSMTRRRVQGNQDRSQTRARDFLRFDQTLLAALHPKREENKSYLRGFGVAEGRAMMLDWRLVSVYWAWFLTMLALPIGNGLSKSLDLPVLEDLGLYLHMAFFWATVLGLGYAGSAIDGLRKRLVQNPPKGLCPDCGYDLSDHNPSSTPTSLECPECGSLSYAVMKWLEATQEAQPEVG